MFTFNKKNRVNGQPAGAGTPATPMVPCVITSDEHPEWLRSLFNAMPCALLGFDRNRICRFCNPAFSQHFGWEADEVRGAEVDFIPRHIIASFYSDETRTLPALPSHVWRTPCRDKNHRLFDIRYSLHPCMGPDNKHGLGMVVFHAIDRIDTQTGLPQAPQPDLARQISQGQRAQKINQILFLISNAVNTTENLDALYASIHVHLSTIIDLSNFFIAKYDKASSTITFPYLIDQVDEPYAPFIDFSKKNSLTGEVILSGAPTLLKKEDIRLRVAENRLLGTPPQIWIGVPLKIRGEVIGVMCTQSYTDPDHFDQMDLDILTSVSDQVAIAIERKRSEQALRKSEDKYRTILSSIEDGYYEVDMTGRFTFFNQALCTILGYDERTLAGMSFEQLMDEENAAKVREAFRHVQDTGQAVKARDWRLFRKDGTACDLECGVSLIPNTDGAALGFRGMARDVSERVRSEKQRKRLEARLQQAQRLESLGKLAGGIAHDFNNLMMGILGRASMIMANTPESHPHHAQLKGIEDCVKSATNLTRRLLGFARGGKYHVKPAYLSHLIQKSVDMFGRTKKEVAMSTHFQQDAWAVEVDANQIEQVLLNLFVNAWQAMPGGGRVYISTENMTIDASEARALAITKGRYVRMCVTDTGIGIDQNIIQKIFDPFFTTKDMGGGTGLGLASVYGIVKNHKGAITVYSEVGQGTTFKIYLPATEKMVPAEKTAPTAALKKGTEKILLVDDEDLIIDVGLQVLEMLGYKVITASSGKHALQLYRKHHETINLVIIDMIMPEMNGGELYDRLKQFNPTVKVLLSSGYSMNDQALEILKKGCNGFIQKPFNISQIADKIREVLETT